MHALRAVKGTLLWPPLHGPLCTETIVGHRAQIGQSSEEPLLFYPLQMKMNVQNQTGAAVRDAKTIQEVLGARASTASRYNPTGKHVKVNLHITRAPLFALKMKILWAAVWINFNSSPIFFLPRFYRIASPNLHLAIRVLEIPFQISNGKFSFRFSRYRRMLQIFLFVSTQVCEHTWKLQMHVSAWPTATPQRIYVLIAWCTFSELYSPKDWLFLE